MVGLESRKLGDILKLVNGLVFLVLVNLIVSNYFIRLDLTEEKRYSITKPTREMLENLDDNVYVDVFLEGDLPAGFKRLQIVIRETLEEFRVYSNNKVQYTFIDPEVASTSQSRDEYMMSIAEKGIQPTDIFLNENGNRAQKRILPGALVTYGIREKGVTLLKGNKGTSSDNQLNQSAEGIEYQLASVIRALTKDTPEVIGLTTSHGELKGNDILSFKETLTERFIVNEIDQMSTETLTGVDLLIMAKPEERFSSQDKYYIDQYILGGGKMIFLIDALKAESDSVSMAFPYELGLDDQLFKYGVRINKDLIQDMFSLSEPIVVGNMGDQPQIQMLPWPFFPLINSYGEHPIVRNLDALSTNYVNSIDTVKADGVVKTPLIFSSPYSRTLKAPVRIALNELKKPIEATDFTRSNIPIGYLLEGNFTSVFKNRPLPDIVKNDTFREEGQSAIVVISDGDLVRNKLDPQNGSPLPVGYDYYSRRTFANEDFLLNIVQYLLNDEGLIQSRNKEIILRPLDKVKVESQKSKWQIINLVLPIVVLVIYGLISNFIRKKKYSSF